MFSPRQTKSGVIRTEGILLHPSVWGAAGVGAVLLAGFDGILFLVILADQPMDLRLGVDKAPEYRSLLLKQRLPAEVEPLYRSAYAPCHSLPQENEFIMKTLKPSISQTVQRHFHVKRARRQALRAKIVAEWRHCIHTIFRVD
jgi:hypothetical protein